jgi:hypothetical protein
MSRITGHSAHAKPRVKISLILHDWELQVDQLGPDSLLLKEPIAGQPAEGRLLLEVDGVQRAWSVLLPDGLSLRSRRVRIRAMPD